ncbi:MAG TPA: FAD-binding oxidoreductase [Bacteroidia bacterium]|nr:FAD-binding oxidoreductase [Bacteroidia bacterium]
MEYNLSYWERRQFIDKIDVCIVGAGLVGLHTAIAIKLKHPVCRILLLERGPLPYGASTRNAGFACFGSISELLDDLKDEDETRVFTRVKKRWDGLNKLRKLTGDAAIKYETHGGFELFKPSDAEQYHTCLTGMEKINRLTGEITGLKTVYREADDRIKPFGFKGVSQLIENSAEGQLDTGRMMQVLEAKARQLGVLFLNGITVTTIHPGNNPEIETDKGIKILPAKILLTTNGFSARLMKNTGVQPARAQVLITKPIEHLKCKGTFHYDKGYYYFRNVNNRILLGGGRNMDFAGETTDTFGITTLIQSRLDSMLNEMILPDQEYTVDMRWSGIMGMGPTREPTTKELLENVYCAVGMGGMGVAIGAVVGEEAAQLVMNDL